MQKPIGALSTALDLTREHPRSPREKLAGYVIAARALDKCRAAINGTLGEYKSGCRLDDCFFHFSGISYGEFKAFVATGATDSQVAEWIITQQKVRSETEIVRWNNLMRERRLSELPDSVQVFLEDYIEKNVPKHKAVRVWFDVYDFEEGRF